MTRETFVATWGVTDAGKTTMRPSEPRPMDIPDHPPELDEMPFFFTVLWGFALRPGPCWLGSLIGYVASFWAIYHMPAISLALCYLANILGLLGWGGIILEGIRHEFFEVRDDDDD